MNISLGYQIEIVYFTLYPFIVSFKWLSIIHLLWPAFTNVKLAFKVIGIDGIYFIHISLNADYIDSSLVIKIRMVNQRSKQDANTYNTMS